MWPLTEQIYLVETYQCFPDVVRVVFNKVHLVQFSLHLGHVCCVPLYFISQRMISVQLLLCRATPNCWCSH